MSESKLREALERIVALGPNFEDNRRSAEGDIRCYVCQAYSTNELVDGSYRIVFQHKPQCPVEIAKAVLAASQPAGEPRPQIDNWIAEFSLTNEADALDNFTLDEQATIWRLMRTAWNTAVERTSGPAPSAALSELRELSKDLRQKAMFNESQRTQNTLEWKAVAFEQKRIADKLDALHSQLGADSKDGGGK